MENVFKIWPRALQIHSEIDIEKLFHKFGSEFESRETEKFHTDELWNPEMDWLDTIINLEVKYRIVDAWDVEIYEI